MMANNNQIVAQALAKEYNRINLIFHAILAPPLVAFVWLYLESNAGNISPLIDDVSTVNMMSFVFPILTVSLIIGAFLYFKSGLKTINPDLELVEKVKTYSIKSVVLYMMLEMGLILGVVGYFMTQENVFLAMYMIVLIFFSLYKPTLERVTKHLNLKDENRELLINCRSIARGEEKENSPVKF